MVVSVALCLDLTRGLTFHFDDLLYFDGSDGFRVSHLLGPHNGHLILVVRLIYAICLKLFGGAHYWPYRLIEAVGVALVAGVFFTGARRRVGPMLALAPSVLLLFLGTSWQDALDPVGIAHVCAIAAGLGALLVLDARPRGADVAACVLLTASIATFSSGIAFCVGAAVLILGRNDRIRRAWIVVIPVALYLVWLAAPELHTSPFTTQDGFALSNVMLIPNYIANAAAAAAAAISGLGYNFTNPAAYEVNTMWGALVAVAIVVGIVIRGRRGGLPLAFWSSAATLLTLWILEALVTHPASEPDQQRYVYDGAVLVLLVGVDALAGITFSRAAMLAALAALIVSLAANIDLLRAGSGYLRGLASIDRAQLGAVSIARGHESPHFVPQGEPTLTFIMTIIGGAGPYLTAVDRNGNPGLTVAALRAQPEALREAADSTLAKAEQLALVPAAAPGRSSACQRVGVPGHALDVRSPGVLIRSPRAQPATLGRFGALATVPLGNLAAGRFDALRVPADRAPDPWHLALASGPVTVCPISPAASG